MKKPANGRQKLPFTLTAGALTQLLASFACFLGAYVLPWTFPELQGLSSRVLLTLGYVTLVLGIANLLFGRQIARLLHKAGKRSRVVIPREGIAYLAIMLSLAVGALMGHRNMPLLVFGMMAGPFILNGWIVYGMLKGIELQRRLPRRASVGESVPIELQVTNKKRLLATHMLEVHDQVTELDAKSSAREVEGVVTFVRIPPRSQRTGRYHLRFPKRGRYRIGPARISSRFPLGIGERGQLMSDSASLIIHPAVGRLLPSWRRQQKELAESVHRTFSRPGLFDDEFHRIREYRDDDNPRSIHWRSSARRGVLMIREHQQNRQADSLIILDLPDLPEWSEQASEMAISLAATICMEQAKAASGSTFLLGLAGHEDVVVATRMPAGFRDEALDALAVCQRSKNANLEHVLSQVVAESKSASDLILLITPRRKAAMDALQNVSAQRSSGWTNLMGMTTIVDAFTDTMSTMFVPMDQHAPSSSRNNLTDTEESATTNAASGDSRKLQTATAEVSA